MKGAPFLLFDLGGVLIENSGFEKVDALLPEAIGVDALKQRWLESPAVRSFELGQITPQEFAEELVATWALPWSVDEFIAEFVSWPRGFYPGAAELLTELRRTHRVGCLSNSNELHWKKFNGLEGHFDVALSSHLIGVIKPDRECFERALSECDVDASDVLFFDDAIANVLAANRLGMRGVHVNGFDELKTALRNEGATIDRAPDIE